MTRVVVTDAGEATVEAGRVPASRTAECRRAHDGTGTATGRRRESESPTLRVPARVMSRWLGGRSD